MAYNSSRSTVNGRRTTVALSQPHISRALGTRYGGPYPERPEAAFAKSDAIAADDASATSRAPSENFVYADIKAGVVGPDQPEPVAPDE